MRKPRYRAGKRLWEPADDALLRKIYPHHSTATVAKRLRRTVEAIYGRANKFGLHKSAKYLASPDAYRLRRGDNVGAAFRFRPGHVPANKGLRRPGWAPGRMKDTQFKAGTRHGEAAKRWKPIGSTRLVDGYVYRKMTDTPKVPWTRNWTVEHRRIWTEANGPIPNGYALAFRNGDRADIRLDNLELIPRRALMTRNSVHNLPAPLAQAVQLLGALHRQIGRKTQHGSQEQDH